ncbi:hypothetical protein DAEQUDRAFT_730057 [Daedalea quercina L-15889]|uniref:Uncharacterized protein n=1 Tax=Daedalea quercina L-15889 TaxID=1314783 RepID=A0A165N870_9APHY|nr:hypothetical protein DAEQUDRAFT_730057 [Daedalea quercina L-15889]
MSTIVNSLQGTLLSHFYLNLHEAGSSQVDARSTNTSQLSDLHFTRVVGSLGGSLAFISSQSTVDGEDMDSGLDLDPDAGREDRQGIGMTTATGCDITVLDASSAGVSTLHRSGSYP